jgi:Nif-specific regulatory protein
MVALKLLRSRVEGMNAEELLATFKFEFSLLKGLSHPNIVRIFDFGYDEALQRFYFTQELVAGTSLTEFSREETKPSVLENLFLQALQGLAYLHSQNVVHGDIKPDNLLVTRLADRRPHLKMIDFGISHPEWAGMGGTPAYIAPEKILKMGSDAKSDLYSLGAVFFQTLTGKNPFLRDQAAATVQAQLNYVPPAVTSLRPEIDPVWSELITAMLQKNPRRRIASAESCIRFLETKGEVQIAAERPRELPSYWMGREEILEQAKTFLRNLDDEPKHHRLLLLSGERGLGKENLLNEMKYEAELMGIEVASWGERPSRPRAVRFLRVNEAGEIPSLTQTRQALKDSAVVLAGDPWIVRELQTQLKEMRPENLTLRPLSLQETETYLKDLTRNKAIPAPFRDTLYRFSRGYPAPLLEALRHLLKDPLIVDTSGKWNLAVFEEAAPTLEQLGLSESSLAHALGGEGVADPAERWILMLKRAEEMAKRGEYEESLKLLGQLESELPQVFTQETRLENRALLLEKRGWIYSKQRRYAEAREAFASALSFLKELKRPPKVLELRLRNFHAFLNLQEGRIDEAIAEFESAHREAESLPEAEQRRITNNELGQAYLAKGESEKAIAQLSDDGEFFSRHGNSSLLMKTYYNLAEALTRAVRHSEAIEAYGKVAALAREGRDWEYLLRAYNGMGNVASLKKDYPASLDYYQRALGLAEYLRDWLSAATVAQNRGVILSEEHRPDEALHDLELSRRLLGKVAPSSHTRYLMARVTLEIGEIHRKKKNFPAAQNYFTEALSRSEEDPNLKSFRFYPLASLARVALTTGDVSAFRDLYPKLIHVANTEEERSILADLLSQAPTDPRQGLEAPEPVAEGGERSMLFRGGFPRDAFQQILKINRALITELDPQVLFKKILQYATELSGAESALLIELTEDGEFSVREAFNTEIDHTQREISQQVAARVLNTGESVVTRDAQLDKGFNQFQSVVSLHLKSIACIPIKVHQKIVGLLYLTHRYKAGLFSPDMVNALEAFGDQAGLALQNSRFVAALTQRNRELNNRLEDAEGEIDRLKSDLRLKIKNPYPKILGKSRPLVEILRLMDRISDTNLSVLILGETGSGKEVVARSIHENSRRRQGPFVAVNCGAIPETLIESELFGYKSGAFTGATRDKKGLLEEAHQGTLFLDEIAELPLATQVKLLRVLQEREVVRLGDTKAIAVDIRVISATHRNLDAWIREAKFREDLYYRVAQMVLAVPSLRDRREDLSLLSEHFLAEAAVELGAAKPPRLAKDLLAQMLRYDWPGNIRELENFLRTAAAFAERGIIHSGTLPDFLRHKLTSASTAKPQAVEPEGAGTLRPASPNPTAVSAAGADWKWDEYEAALFSKALLQNQMNCEKAAEALGVGVATVYVKMRRYALKTQAHRYESLSLPYPDSITLAEFKRRLILDTFEKKDKSPYAVARTLGLNVGTVYRYLDFKERTS